MHQKHIKRESNSLIGGINRRRMDQQVGGGFSDETRVSLDNLNFKNSSLTLKNLVDDSSNRLKRRDKGMPSILRASWDNSAFLDKFVADLNEIEYMNNRMERDIEAKTQERIRTYGTTGSKILGIDV